MPVVVTLKLCSPKVLYFFRLFGCMHVQRDTTVEGNEEENNVIVSSN